MVVGCVIGGWVCYQIGYFNGYGKGIKKGYKIGTGRDI
jgi:hypothetical protein